MALTIPVSSDASHYEFEVELDGQTYTFELRWNARAKAWFLTISADGKPLLSGRRLVLGVNLLAQSRSNPDLPPGELNLIDTTGGDVEAGREDLGSRVQLLYLTRDELAELRGGG